MAVTNQPATLGDVVALEHDLRYCRDTITILAGSGSDRVLTLGMVVGKITASGKWVQQDPAAADGSQNAAGVLVADVTAPNGTDARGVALVRGPCTLKDAGIVWKSGMNTTQKDAAIAQLNALGMVVRLAL